MPEGEWLKCKTSPRDCVRGIHGAAASSRQPAVTRAAGAAAGELRDLVLVYKDLAAAHSPVVLIPHRTENISSLTMKVMVSILTFPICPLSNKQST